MLHVGPKHPRHSEFTEIYEKQADATLKNQVDEIRKLHAPGFHCIPLDGSKRSEDQWAASVQRDIDIHQYSHVAYEIEKITEMDGHATVYSTRRCAGVNDAGKRFNTEVRLKDEFVLSPNPGWRMTSSETVSRALWLDGTRLTLDQIPNVVALEQGCSDHGGIGAGD